MGKRILDWIRAARGSAIWDAAKWLWAGGVAVVTVIMHWILGLVRGHPDITAMFIAGGAVVFFALIAFVIHRYPVAASQGHKPATVGGTLSTALPDDAIESRLNGFEAIAKTHSIQIETLASQRTEAQKDFDRRMTNVEGSLVGITTKLDEHRLWISDVERTVHSLTTSCAELASFQATAHTRLNYLEIELPKLSAHISEVMDSVNKVRAPRVVPVRYAKMEPATAQRQYGILLANDGGDSAHDVKVETFTLGGQNGWQVEFDEIYRLGSGSQEIAAVQISGRNTALDLDWILSQWLHGEIMMDNKTGDITVPGPVAFNVVYRNHANNWFRSVCELGRDVLNLGGTYVRFIRQEPITAPPKPLAATP